MTECFGDTSHFLLFGFSGEIAHLAAFFIMGASTIIDALQTMLSAASAFGSDHVSKGDYNVLESTSGSCVVLEWSGLELVDDTFGSLTRHNWTITARMFAKDLGHAQATATRTLTCIDTLASVLKDDFTLLGTVERVTGIRSERELVPEGTIEVGGAFWFEMPVEIDVWEWPDG